MQVSPVNNVKSNISLQGVRGLYNSAKNIGYKIYDEQASVKSARNALALDMGVNIKNGFVSIFDTIRDSFIKIIK